MKILFINQNILGQEYIPLGIAYLSSYIKSKGHESYLFDYTWGNTNKNCIKRIKQLNPDLICFSLDSGRYKSSIKLAKIIKAHFDIPIIFGGSHPTVSPEETIKNPYVDIICIGEGEEALSELLTKIKNKVNIYKTKNFWFKKNNKIIKNPVRPLIQDLDKLPFPDREIFNLKKYLEVTNKVEMIVGRGCPYNCNYCINHIYQKIYRNKGKYVRMRSVKNVLEEIQFLVDNYDIKFIYFDDDTFTIFKNWIIKFCKEYKKRFNIPFNCNTRVETLDKEVLIELKKAGCKAINMGVETGSEKLRKRILRRNTTNQQILNTFKLAKEIGLATYSSNMIGIPYETKKEYLETIKLNQLIKPTFMQASIYQPYPGTDLSRLCLDKGWISNKFLPKSYGIKSIMNYPNTPAYVINWRRSLFRFRILKKYALIKAFMVLLLDLNNNLFFKVRRKIPLNIKKVLFKLDKLLRKW